MDIQQKIKLNFHFLIQILNLYINLYILLLIIKKKLIFFRKNKLN